MYHIKIGEETYPVYNPVWIRLLTFSGKTTIIACLEKDATGIFYEDVNYHIEGKPEMPGLQTVELVWKEPEEPEEPELPEPDGKYTQTQRIEFIEGMMEGMGSE